MHLWEIRSAPCGSWGFLTSQSIFMVSARTKAFAVSALKWRDWFFGSLFGSYGVVLQQTFTC